MSASFISIVPVNVNKVEAKELADKVIDHLTKKKIINRELTDCILGKNGHSPGDNFKDAIDGDDYGLKDLLTNGLEIITTREVFHNGGNEINEINCPNCKTNIIEADWIEAINEWANETGLDIVTCPNCSIEHSITDYNFIPTWGFGDLGFTFWNWPDLKDEFIKDIEKTLKRPVKLIYGRL
jgi:hypothetical protein